jgi:nicotinamidase-related amidase
MNANVELIEAQDCVLLLVDIQKVLLDLCVDPERTVVNAAGLIEIAGIFEIPVLFTVHNAQKLGGFMPELTGKVASPKLFAKMEFDCFKNGAIAAALEQTGRKTLLLAGIEGHVCIMHTGLGALSRGYRVHLASDAISSRSTLNREVGLHRLDRAGAVISSTEMILFELLKRAGTPEFRTALPLIKTLQP